MAHVLIAFASVDGYTKKVAEGMAETIRKLGSDPEVCNLKDTSPRHSLSAYDAIIAGGPIHIKRHPQLLRRFIESNLSALSQTSSAFFSVSLSAAGGEEQRGNARQCLLDFLKQTGWQPDSETIIAGALRYRQYGFFKRWLMKWIAKREGGDTNTSRDYEYTDWGQLEQFVTEFIRQAERTDTGVQDSVDTTDRTLKA